MTKWCALISLVAVVAGVTVKECGAMVSIYGPLFGTAVLFGTVFLALAFNDMCEAASP